MFSMRLVWIGMGIILSLGLAACGQSAHGSNPPVAVQKSGHVTHIYPTPKATEMATVPASNGMMWILAGNHHAQALFPLELTSHTVGKGIALNASTIGVGQVPAGSLFTIQNGSTARIIWRSPTTAKRSGALNLPSGVVTGAAGQAGRHIYLVCESGTQSKEAVIVTTGPHAAIAGTWPVSPSTISVAPTPSGRHLYALTSSGQITEWSTKSHKAASQFSIGQSGRSLVINPAGTTLYALKGRRNTRNIAVVSLATENVSSVLPAPAYARQIVMSASGRVLYAVVGTSAYGNVQEITNLGG